jgi:hypothetical protein
MCAQRPELTQVSRLRAADLSAPEWIAMGGPVTGLSRPVGDIPVLGGLAVALAGAAVFALLHLSFVGFVFFGLFALVACGVLRIRLRRAAAPAVSVGPGGVWLAGTERRRGQGIAWHAVAELVFCAVVEHDTRTPGKASHRVLGVRLRAPIPIPAAERQLVDDLGAMAPQVHDRVSATADLWESMPYRPIGRLRPRQRRAFTAAVARLAPSVSVVNGPRLDAYLPWAIGEGDTP